MARIIPKKNKEGKLISYQIRIYRGRDANGKELSPYCSTWKIPSTYKSESAIQKGLQKFVSNFEAEYNSGKVTSDKRTFEEYANYFLQLKQFDCKKSGIRFYTSLLPRINENIGRIRIKDLKPEHLNQFYLKLENPQIRQDTKAYAKEFLINLRSEKQYTLQNVEDLSGLSSNTIRLAFQRKNISLESAEKIARVFNTSIKQSFELINGGNGKGLSPKTIRHYHNFIHDVLELAVKEGLIVRNVADMAAPPKLKRKDAEYFEINEIIQIRNALIYAPEKYRIMIYILVETGCRRGELFGLRWSSIDFNNNTILINNNVQYIKEYGLYEESPKNGESRTLSIASEVIEALKIYKEHQEKEYQIENQIFNEAHCYLFEQENGNPMNPSSLNHWMKKFEKNYNLPHIYPHKFRHSQASILYVSGVDTITISKRLGHKQVSTTQNIYSHILQNSDRNASEAIANTLYRKHIN